MGFTGLNCLGDARKSALRSTPFAHRPYTDSRGRKLAGNRLVKIIFPAGKSDLKSKLEAQFWTKGAVDIKCKKCMFDLGNLGADVTLFEAGTGWNQPGRMLMNPKQFRQWRKALGLKQKEAAELLGLKKRMIQYYEKGERNGKEIKIPKYVRLACYAVSRGVDDFDGERSRERRSPNPS